MLQSLLSFDTHLLIWARGLVGPNYATAIQFLGESIVIWSGLYLVGLWLYGLKAHDNRYKLAALMIFSTIILTFTVYTLINFGFDKWRPSPQDVVGGIKPLIPHPLDNSFPSGHALFTGAFLIALFAFAREKSIILITVIIGFLTAAARVIAGVHYPGDIIAGWGFGLIGGLLFVRVVSIDFMRQKIFFPIIRLIEYIRL
ncbi:MAG: undecaprenyl-diphosphatase [Candidatus Altimarinota bacterium]